VTNGGRALIYTFFRVVMTNPTTSWDFLSQAARRQPPPRDDPAFLKDWAGLSVRDTYRAAWQFARSWKWKHGHYIAVLQIPHDAPLTFVGPGHRGHWMIYDQNGNALLEDGAELIRRNYVTHVLHGPSVESFTL
jgi:hypothetical protein